MKHLLPTNDDVKEMLSMIFGEGLTVTAHDGDAEASYVAIYVDEDNNPGAAILCDAGFAASAGAALSMLPPGAAEDAAKAKELTDTMRENLYEVMNICTRLLIGESTPHLRLTELSDRAATNADTSIKDASKVSHEVNIPQYGAGTLSFVVS